MDKKKTIINWIKDNKESVLAVTFFVVLLGIFGPIELYFGNRKDFEFKWGDFFWALLVASVIIEIIMILMLYIIPQKISELLSSVITCLALGMYLQNMFLNVKLSETNGSEMDWKAMSSVIVINTVIWLVYIIIFFILRWKLKKYWKKIILCTSSFITALLVVSVIGLITTDISGAGFTKEAVILDGEGQYQIADNKNVILFIIDSLDNENFELAMAEEDFPKAFSDFTYFDNADCHYYYTYPSVTHMLTTYDFNFEQSSREWTSEAWNCENANYFYDSLHNAGYNNYLYSGDGYKYEFGTAANLAGKYDNALYTEAQISNKSLLKRMIKFDIYKFSPYILKPFFELDMYAFKDVIVYGQGGISCTANAEYYSGLKETGLTTGKCANAFIIQYLIGTHMPYVSDRECNYIDNNADCTAVDCTIGICKELEEYINQLKELGVYDDSVIIITADHGSWAKDGSYGQPFLLIKSAGATSDTMKVNSSPVSHDDLLATILDELEIDYSNLGKSMNDWKEDDSRARTVYVGIFDDNYPSDNPNCWNVYYGYKYDGDRNTLKESVTKGPADIQSAMSYLSAWRN